MSTNSAIEWTDATWNPVRGCTKISPGCRHCYAEAFAERFRGVAGHAYEQGFDVRLAPHLLDEPLRWRDRRPTLGRPLRIFVNSMADLFHEDVPDAYRDRVLARMLLTPWHTYQVLTKRADAMQRYLGDAALYPRVFEVADRDVRPGRPKLAAVMTGRLAPWIWWGVSVEDRRYGAPRIDALRATPAASRFLSIEPLLEDVGDLDLLRGIRWVIVGGESGRGARECRLEWIRSVVRQCRRARIPCFVKQLGAAASDAANGLAGATLRVDPDASALVSVRLRHRKGGDRSEWPADLDVQQFPVDVFDRDDADGLTCAPESDPLAWRAAAIGGRR